MKFLHTSDLHIGLRLSEYSMLEDCRHILSEISELAVSESCDAVILAGDLYDRSAPSAEAVAVLDSFISDLAAHGIAVLAVSGNHDSPERVAYLSSVARSAGVYFSPVYDGGCECVTFSDEYGPIDVWLLPFVRPVQVRLLCDGFEGDTFAEAVGHIVSALPLDETRRNVMVTHQFVIGGTVAEEDVGGVGFVPSSVFERFDYVALGHLHNAHAVGEVCRYSGSPLRYSFGEVNDEKSVYTVELFEKGRVEVVAHPLHPIRELREVRGTYDEVVHEGLHDPRREDYIRVVLTDEEDVVDAMAKLRSVYPNLMRIVYDNTRTREYRVAEVGTYDMEEELSPESVFAELFELQNNVPPSEELSAVVRGIFERCAETEEAI